MSISLSTDHICNWKKLDQLIFFELNYEKEEFICIECGLKMSITSTHNATDNYQKYVYYPYQEGNGSGTDK